MTLAVSIPEAAKLAGIGVNAMYDRVASGEIGSVSIGRRRIIPVKAIEDWLEREAARSQQRSAKRARPARSRLAKAGREK